MIDLNHINDILSDPATDALARAYTARLPNRSLTEPIAVLRGQDALYVVARVGSSHATIRHSNRFVILTASGLPVWNEPCVGLSEVAHLLHSEGWNATQLECVEVETKKSAQRLITLMRRLE